MSDMDKTIERVKEEIDFAAKGDPEPLYCEHLIYDTVAIITAYEQSQKGLEEEKTAVQFWRNCTDVKITELSKAQAELETANKRIAELEIKFDKQQMYIGLLEQSFSEKVDNETFVSEKEYCVDTVQIRFVEEQTENDDRFLEK